MRTLATAQREADLRTTLLLTAAVVLLSACQATDAALLAPGDCFDDFGDVTAVATVEILDCAEPHDNEVYGTFQYEGASAYPGDDVVFDYGTERCLESFDRFVGIAYEESELDIGLLYPSSETWNEGDRQIQCFVYEFDGSKVTGSLGSSFR